MSDHHQQEEEEEEPSSLPGGAPLSIRVDLAVGGMMCQKNCGATVRNALLSIEGVLEAESSFAERRAYAVFIRTKKKEENDENNKNKETTTSASASYYRHCLEEAVDMIECVGFEAEEIDDLDAYLAKVRLENGREAEEKRKREEENVVADYDDDENDAIEMMMTSSSAGGGVVVAFSLKVGGMSCAVCTGRVERCLRDVEGVEEATVVLSTGRAMVKLADANDSDSDNKVQDACVRAVLSQGYDCELVRKTETSTLRDSAEEIQQSRQLELRQWKRLVLVSVLLTVPIVVLDRHNHHGGGGDGDSAATAHPSTESAAKLWVEFVLSSLVQFGVGYRFYKAALKGLRHGGTMGMDFLIVMGTTASYVYSVTVFVLATLLGNDSITMKPSFATGPMLLSFVTIGKFLECYATGKTASALQALMELQPSQATKVVAGDGSGGKPKALDATTDIASLATEQVGLGHVRVGDYLVVQPGARIPTDAKVVAVSGSNNSNGSSSSSDYSRKDSKPQHAYVDESALSGEPFPVAKGIGDDVYGSTVNQLSSLLVRVEATGDSTVLAKIVRLMEDAQRNKAPIQAYADRIAQVFAPTVMVLSALTLTGWLFFNSSAHGQERLFVAIMSAISVIVVACPCALGLATPTAVMVGTGVGAQNALLIKGGAALEMLHSITHVVLDKTGTLTTGTAVLGDHTSFVDEGDQDEDLYKGMPSALSRHQLPLWLAACAEAQSEHPLAKAIVNAAKSGWGGDVTMSQEGVRVDDFRVVPGKGVECLVTKPDWGSRYVRIGSNEWAKAKSGAREGLASTIEDKTGDKAVTDMRLKGQISVYMSVAESNNSERRVIAVFGIVDPIAKEAPSTVAALQKQGIDVWMCTGDHDLTALAVANQIGIPASNVCANMTPEGKADLVTRLQQEDVVPTTRRHSRNRIAVVGDGINDAVALARADTGIAIGAGTQIACEAADVVLVQSSLHGVVTAIHLSRVVFRRILLNFLWAMSYNVLALPFAAGVFFPFTDFRLPPEFAGLMMAFSSVSVVTSSLLLRNYRKPKVLDDGSLEGGDGILSRLADFASGCCRGSRRRASGYIATKQNDDLADIV